MRFPCIHDFKPWVCLPCPLESLLENRDDDLDCAPRDVWVTPFTPILIKRYIDCWSAPVLMQWRVGRDTGVFEIPRVHLNRFWSCIYICIKLLNLRPGLLNYTTRIKSAHSAGCRDVAISPWYHEAGHWRWLDYTQVSPMMCAAWEPGAWHYFQILS